MQVNKAETVLTTTVISYTMRVHFQKTIVITITASDYYPHLPLAFTTLGKLCVKRMKSSAQSRTYSLKITHIRTNFLASVISDCG